jgi:hypothetical protein
LPVKRNRLPFALPLLFAPLREVSFANDRFHAKAQSTTEGAKRNQTTQMNSVSLSGGWYNSGLLRKINRPLPQAVLTRCRSEL